MADDAAEWEAAAAARRAEELGGLFVPKPFNPAKLPRLVRQAARKAR